MVNYDPKFVEEYAQKLYKEAKSIVGAHFFIGIFTAIIIFGAISIQLTQTLDFLILAIGVMIGGVMGYGSGRNKAISLQLQAQMALCQIEIEKNLRGVVKQ